MIINLDGSLKFAFIRNSSKYSGSYINVSIAAWIKITIYYLNNKIIKKGINL